MSYRMDAESVILQTVFGDHAANRCWFLMNWALLRESGAVALETVYYRGSELEWSLIGFGDLAERFALVNVVYDYEGE